MSLAVYRVCRSVYARLDGEGSRQVGGRWNSPGWPVVYMSQSIALAVLENLVHMSRRDYPTGYVIVQAAIPEHVRILDYTGFLDLQPSTQSREKTAGDYWLASRESAVLRVPSAVAAGDWNYLINPQHLDFAQITVERPVPIHFDPRLFENT